MRAKRSGFCGFIRLTTVTVLFLCASLLSNTAARAQKAPSIFKTEGGGKDGGSMSATNKTYISMLESEYRSLESSNRDRAKILRNKLIFIAVEQIDTVFNDYRRKSRKRNEIIQFLFDFLEVGASTAIAITNGERAKEVIAEALTGFKGGRTSANKNFKLLETQIIFNKMVTNRSERLSAIYGKLNEDVLSYPWERARSELKGYLYAGTVDDALNSLNIGTGSEAKAAEEELKGIKERAGIFFAPTEVEVTAARANADAIDALIDAFADADEKFTKADGAISDANKKIADAEKEMGDAKAKTPPDQAAITKATADKAKAEADKAQATTARDEAKKARDTALSNLKGTYKAIEGDSALSPILEQIPDQPGNEPDFSERLRASLSRLKEGKGSAEDHALILLRFGNIVVRNLSKDPSLNERLQKILKGNK